MLFLRLSLRQNIGLILLLILAALAFIEPVLFNIDGNQQQLNQVLLHPSSQHWLGTDQYGRDMFARISEGLRLSLFLAAICVASSALVGVITGVVAACRRGWLDTLLNFVANTVLALPGLVLVLLFAALLPGSFFMIYLAISLVLGVEYFRLVRACTLPIVNGPALQNSKLMGFGHQYIFNRHIWPAIRSDVFSLAAFGAATSIIAMASIGFVYVGLKPPSPELGLMIVELFPYYHEAPWLLAQPILALFMLVLGFHLLADKGIHRHDMH